MNDAMPVSDELSIMSARATTIIMSHVQSIAYHIRLFLGAKADQHPRLGLLMNPTRALDAWIL